jgi:hypothetical protein
MAEQPSGLAQQLAAGRRELGGRGDEIADGKVAERRPRDFRATLGGGSGARSGQSSVACRINSIGISDRTPDATGISTVAARRGVGTLRLIIWPLATTLLGMTAKSAVSVWTRIDRQFIFATTPSPWAPGPARGTC